MSSLHFPFKNFASPRSWKYSSPSHSRNFVFYFSYWELHTIHPELSLYIFKQGLTLVFPHRCAFDPAPTFKTIVFSPKYLVPFYHKLSEHVCVSWFLIFWSFSIALSILTLVPHFPNHSNFILSVKIWQCKSSNTVIKLLLIILGPSP